MQQPQNKKGLMKAIEHEWELLLEVAEALTDEQMTTPDSGGWSPKDNLAHLAEWMNVLIGYHMDNRPAHKVMRVPEEVTRGWNMEVINPILFERNKDLTHQEVMSKLKRTYQKLCAKLKTTSFKDLMKPRYADDPQKRPLLFWILVDTTDHFKEHRQNIQRELL
jgi:hypothetical protein